MVSFPFRSRVSRFVNGNHYILEIEEYVFIFMTRIGEYLNIEISEKHKVCESFVSHLSRLIECIFSNTLLQGDPQRMEPELENMYKQHSPFIVALFHALFPQVKLSCIEIYYLIVYFCRLEKEVGRSQPQLGTSY